MKKLIPIFFLVCLVSGCSRPADSPECRPQLVTVAPDGTKLWRINGNCSNVKNGAYAIYFSSKGLQTEELRPAGKMFYSAPVSVPNLDSE